ncbi:flagellar motor protein MotB [Inquilinus ginsengisoli]|uniref:Flagellar motor protein MotB n=1 Tax=Inquilinus ginsengisoli TaxID=363840 RepID=A0ABU1JPT6_9PROT|nr:OmpA family protein [Inquilinus ginsengisoli]MDR6290636.1 flagellar motor protein MotB [Inquilinus ginsengisoli]
MRTTRRARRAEEEEESAFISMTDMTVSFLFIIMILLAFFATQIAPKNSVPQERYDRVAGDLADRDRQVLDLLGQIEQERARRGWTKASEEAERKQLLARISELEARVRIDDPSPTLPMGDLWLQVRQQREENDRLLRLLAAQEVNPIERYNFRSAELRGRMLDRIQKRIQAADMSIDVSISRNGDALEFKGDGLFGSGSDVPSLPGRRKMEMIAGILNEELRCFSFGDRTQLSAACNPAVALIDALQIEGHTDNTGTDVLNMDLSSRRGTSVYSIMVTASPDLLGFHNLKDQPILSVAGYGKGRPIRDNESDQSRDANRRIDLRFIMFAPAEEQYIPQRIEDLPRLQRLLLAGPAP